jgi:hypothetical protein
MDIESMRAALATLGLRLRHSGNGATRHDVLNIVADGRETTRADVDAFRALLAGHDLTEVESWVAGEGVSWLSDGITSVSFEVYDPNK